MLYVVDSVTRRWVDHAKQQGQQINSSAPDGTYAAGVHRVTELLPVLMNDILQNAPPEQKVRFHHIYGLARRSLDRRNARTSRLSLRIPLPHSCRVK